MNNTKRPLSQQEEIEAVCLLDELLETARQRVDNPQATVTLYFDDFPTLLNLDIAFRFYRERYAKHQASVVEGGRKGGQAVTGRKRQASRENAAKARAAKAIKQSEDIS